MILTSGKSDNFDPDQRRMRHSLALAIEGAPVQTSPTPHLLFDLMNTTTKRGFLRGQVCARSETKPYEETPYG